MGSAIVWRSGGLPVDGDAMRSQQTRTLIKICGIRDPEMGRFAIEAGAGAIGMVFYATSPRAVEVEAAKNIVSALPTHALSVALFVNPDADFVRHVIDQVRPSLLQFHGDEPPDFCDQFDTPYWKAIRVSAATDLLELRAKFTSAERLLLDAEAKANGKLGTATLYGGTGEVFDWKLIPDELGRASVLSGGLTPANVGSAIAAVRPWAVDVSSGVEVQKGVKSRDLIQRFIEAVEKEDSREQAV
jgi:phosphoribosylanthranilate isomerase